MRSGTALDGRWRTLLAMVGGVLTTSIVACFIARGTLIDAPLERLYAALFMGLAAGLGVLLCVLLALYVRRFCMIVAGGLLLSSAALLVQANGWI